MVVLEVPRMDPGVIQMVPVAPLMVLVPPPTANLGDPLMGLGVLLLMDPEVLRMADPPILVPTAKLARGRQM